MLTSELLGSTVVPGVQLLSLESVSSRIVGDVGRFPGFSRIDDPGGEEAHIRLDRSRSPLSQTTLTFTGR
jgi:hypothetical protein